MALSIGINTNKKLFVSNLFAGTVGQYDATTGATINANFINGGQGLNWPSERSDRNNHLFVASNGTDSVAEYNATTGATINATFINSSQGLSNPVGLAMDGNNHLFVANAVNSTVGEYDATTGATINPAFINDPGLNTPAAFGAGRKQPPLCV